MDSKRNLQIKSWYTFTKDERHPLKSNKANYIYLNARKCGSNRPTFHQSTQYHMAVRSKASLDRNYEGRGFKNLAQNTVRPPSPRSLIASLFRKKGPAPFISLGRSACLPSGFPLSENLFFKRQKLSSARAAIAQRRVETQFVMLIFSGCWHVVLTCLLYTSPSPRDFCRSRMPSSA